MDILPQKPGGGTRRQNAGFSKHSPDGAQRNPGFSYATQQPWISLRFIRATAATPFGSMANDVRS
jgi:hypothetical protein